MIPLIVAAGYLAYSWTLFLDGTFLPMWRHDTGLLLFPLLIVLFFKNFPKGVVGLGVYLLPGTFNRLAITPAVRTQQLSIGSFALPPVQLLLPGLFGLYFILNLDDLIDIRLNYKEQKNKA